MVGNATVLGVGECTAGSRPTVRKRDWFVHSPGAQGSKGSEEERAALRPTDAV